MWCGVQGLGFRASGLGVRISDWVVGCGFYGLVFRDEGLVLRVES